MKKIRRFPRLAEDYPELATKKKIFMGVDITNGRVPVGYDKVTKKMKKAVKYLVNGMAVRDMCHKVDINCNTWYRWINLNERLKRYYLDYARKMALVSEGRLDAKVGRAVRVVEDSLDNPDPYFAHDAAVKLLSGRGLYKKNVESQRHISGAVLHGHLGKIKHEVVDKDLMLAFVDALTGRAIGPPEKKERIISAKVLKQLPEPKHGFDTEVQKSVEAEVL